MKKKKLCILIVEDVPSDAELLEFQLRKGGMEYISECVETKEDFLKMLREFKPDLILSDYSLPDFDGMTALRLTQELAPTTPFILVTGSMNEETAVECIKAGAADYILKDHIIRIVPAIKAAFEKIRVAGEKEKAEKDLKESEERYRSLFERVPVGLYRTTPEGQVIDVNPGLVHLLGYSSREAMITLNVADEYGDEKERKRWQTLMEREGVVRGFETRWRRFDGTLIWVRESALAIRDKEGRITHYEGVVEDITEHKQAEEKLQESEANLKEAQALGRMGNWEFDLDKQTIQWSDQVYRLYERDPALGPPTVEEEAAYYSPEQAERLHEYSRIAAEQGRAYEYDLEARLPSGRIAHFAATMRPFEDGGGRIVKLFGTVQDITERKRAEEQLQKSFQQTKKVLEEVVWALSAIVEKRDPYTAGHQRRVADLACAIAGELNLPEVQIEGIRVAGLIHDIGKMNVPAEILSKTGRLSEAEFSMIKTHAQVGKEILESIDFPWPVAQVVHQHHERLNGTGYPQGLSDGKIILEAKIMAVADVVEAMASHRPYRPALGIEKALEEILNQSGILYDPQVVDACRELFDKKGYKLAQESAS
jgi:PAS domain S-box-containing protein/putative nucleotidyltransferase with HDIG domain